MRYLVAGLLLLSLFPFTYAQDSQADSGRQAQETPAVADTGGMRQQPKPRTEGAQTPDPPATPPAESAPASVLEQAEAALQRARDENDLTAKAAALNRIGLIYQNRLQFTRALGYFHRSAETGREQAAVDSFLTALKHLARTHERRGVYDSARYYRNRASTLKDSFAIVAEVEARAQKYLKAQQDSIRELQELSKHQQAALAVRAEEVKQEQVQVTFIVIGGVAVLLAIGLTMALVLYRGEAD